MAILSDLRAGNDAPALVSPGETISYAALGALVARVKAELAGPRRLAAIEAEATPDFVTSYLALLDAGHAVALLPPGDAAAAETFRRDFQPEITIARQNGAWRTMQHHHAPRAALHPDLAVMLATSGTEGRPRWVRLSRANIEANAASIASYLGLTATDRAPQTLPFHYSYGLSVLHAHLAAGGSIAFCGASVIDDGFLETAAELGCTGLSGVPFTYELLERVSLRNRLWPALRYMTVAGGRMPPTLVSRYAEAMNAKGGAFYAMYGQTEATARMAYLPPHLAESHPDCIGIAIPGGSFRLGANGELFYRGPNVMMGYATERRHLAGGPELSELATGDLAEMTGDGLLRITGRARRFSKIAGLRIGHEAIEWALRERSIACAVTGLDEAITVHVEAADAEEVRRHAAEVAAIPQRYVRVVRHDALPRLASGKIDYRALGQAAAPAAPAPAPSADLPQAFRTTFYPRPVSAADSFESLEGDSLAYVQVSLAIEARLGELPEGWETMSIAALEKRARGGAAAKPSWFAGVESHIALRAAAILLIVLHHATEWPIPGGAMTLMMLVGYGFARFHREALLEGRVASILHPMLRNLLPYFVVVAGFAIAWQQMPWASLFLMGNFGFADPYQHTMLPFQYWFVEAYAQLCLLTALAFSFGSVRCAVRHRPFTTAFIAMLAAFTLRYGVPLVYDIGLRKIFLLTYVLWLPLLGWAAFHARNVWQKLAILAALGVLCPYAAYYGGNWTGAWVMNLLQIPVVAMLLFLPRLRLPRLMVPGVMLVAASSYHIYLFHRIIPEALGLDAMGPLGIAASVTVGLLTGIAAAALQRVVLTGLSRRAALATREA